MFDVSGDGDGENEMVWLMVICIMEVGIAFFLCLLSEKRGCAALLTSAFLCSGRSKGVL